MICEATKLCGGKHGCGRVLPVSAFYFDKQQNRFRTYCEACDRERHYAWRRSNRIRVAAINLRSKRRNPISKKAADLVAAALHRGPSDIDTAWVMERLERGACELTGVPFTYEHRHPCLPSIDRIDPTQPGHMRANCRVILWGLNAFKGTASEEVFLESMEKVSAAFVKG